MNVTALVAANCRSRKTPSGSIGEAAVWSRTKKAASPSAPATAIASTRGRGPAERGGLDERECDAGEEHHHRRQRARVIDLAGDARVRDSERCRAPSATTAAAMGTLMKNIHRQDAAEIR
jgi:hypothetical protein